MRYDESSQYNQDVPLPKEGSWTIHSIKCTDPSPVHVTRYDNNWELLWTGQKSGRVTSYAPTKFDVTTIDGEIMKPMVSFIAAPDAIIDIISVPSMSDSIIVVSESHISFFKVGGYRYYSSTLQDLLAWSGRDRETSNKFSAVCNVNSFNNYTQVYDNHLFLCTDGTMIIHWDLATSATAIIDGVAPSTSCSTNGNVVVVGGFDGKIRIYDSRFRSHKILSTLDAHTGPVSDACLLSDGTTVVSCGHFDRLKSSFTQQPSIQDYMMDPLVKMFDLRSSKLVGSMSMTLSSPRKLSIFPQANQTDSLVMVSSSGVLQINELSSRKGYTAASDVGQLITFPLAKHFHVSSLAVSSTGHFITCGSDAGVVMKLALVLSQKQVGSVNASAVPFLFPNKGKSYPYRSLSEQSFASSLVLKKDPLLVMQLILLVILS